MQYISQALVDFVVKQTLYSTVLTFIVLLLAQLLWKKSSSLHLALWSLVLFRLVLPPDVSHPLSLRNITQQIFHFENAKQEISPATFVDGTSAIGAPLSSTLENTISISWADVLVTTWILGVFAFLTLFFIRRYRWTKMAASASNLENHLITSIVNEWKLRFGIKRKVLVKLASKTHTPFTVGLWRPVIVLPENLIIQSKRDQVIASDFANAKSRGNLLQKGTAQSQEIATVAPLLRYDLESLEAIIAHEMAHIKRLDDLWIILQHIIQAVYFFHPAVWLTNHHIYVARECVCDSMVLAHGTLSTRAYGRGLITSLTSTFWGLDGAGVLAAFSSPQKIIKTRITNIKKGHAMKIPFVLKIVLVVLAIVILPMASQSKNVGDSAVSVVSAGDESVSFVNPLDGETYRLTSSYGERLHPIKKEKLFHRAVDLAAKEGTPVHAAAAGTITKVVSDAGEGGAMGKYIEVQHDNGFMTRYTQLFQVSVKVGESVSQNEVIGQVGSSGLSTGPHLHFEIWKNGEHVNPADYINF
jgi:beta-lactamase regulating signal transducer with metallopeptidase domain